ncbi:MAG: NAD-dependent epimerase/dehydratase family protein [bacterium]
MRSVLVTGATTPIGTALVRTLLAQPHIRNVLAVAAEPRSRTPYRNADPRVRYFQLDLTRQRNVRELLFGPARDLRVEAVVHTAQHRRATEGGPRVHALNVDAARDLLHLCEEHPTIQRFVFRSSAEVYRVKAEEPVLIQEDHPLELSPRAPQWIRDRVEADLTVCARMGLVPLHIVVLRAAECFACDVGSQLLDYLGSRVCFQPLGFDPMLNLVSTADLVLGLALALETQAQGVFNLPGADTLPLSKAIQLAGRRGIPAPGLVLAPLYALRSRIIGTDFRYDLNRWRFHFSGVLDGRRAKAELSYVPTHPIDWARVPRV